MSYTYSITVEKLKALGIPESEVTEVWNRGNLADSYIPVQEMHFQDGQGNIKRLFVEASMEADVDQPDQIQESFRRHYTLHAGTDVPSSLDTPKEKRSIVLKAGTGHFQLTGSDVSLRIDLAESQSAPPKTALSLVFLLPKTQREVVLGDLAEQYAVVREQRGNNAASRWFYKHICFSIVPLIMQAANRWVSELLCRWTRYFRHLSR